MSAADTGRRAVRIFREEDVPFMAASIAYYALASVVPLLLIALVVLSLVGMTDLLVETLRSSLSSSGEQVLNRVLSNTRGQSVAGAVGFLLALWSGIKVFRGLTVAFAEVYDRESDVSLVSQIVRSLLVLGLLLLAFGLLAATGVLLGYVQPQIPYPRLLGNAAAVLALVVAFLPLYYVLPPIPVSVRHALPGTVVAAVGWVLLQIGFSYYAANAGRYAAYGFLGAILLFVTFLYLAGIVLLVGAVVNVALDR